MGELATRQQEHQSATTLYGDMDALAELAGSIRKVAPWANDPNYPMTDYEVGLVARRCIGMSLDPLNPNEIQIWKDKHGIHFQLAKSLITEWMHYFKGDTTEPRYYRLMIEQLEEEGLTPRHVAYKCTFYMREDLDKITTMIEAQLDTPANVRAMFEIWGIGVATPDEWSGAYFAPAGRSKAAKVQKRALTDAIVKRFGTPTKAEIETLRRNSGTDRISDADWEGAYEVGADERGTVALAADAARRREAPQITAEEVKIGVATLYGEEAVDGIFTEVDQPELADNLDGFDFDAVPEIPYDEKPAPPPPSGLPFLEVDRVGATVTKSGKPCVGLWEPEKQYPTFYWWGGRDALLEVCPWLIDSVTKDELGEVGKTYPFTAKVFYVLNGKFKDISTFERIA